MTKLRNLLRCYAIGMSIKSISSAFNLSRNTVRKYVRRYQKSGLTLDQLRRSICRWLSVRVRASYRWRKSTALPAS